MIDPAQAAPFEACGDRGAVLCLHGMTSTPYQMRPVAEAFAEAGFAVHAPCAQGHGTRPEDFQHTRWSDWIAGYRRAFRQLAERHERVAIVGLSMGALSALVLAHEHGERCAGVVAMATPLEMEWKTQALFRAVRRLPFADALPAWPKPEGPDVSDPAVAASTPGYRAVPLLAAASILDGQKAALDCVERLGVPVLVQHGRHDHIAPVKNAHRLMRCLHTPRRRLIVYPRSWHIITLDVEHEAVVADALGFVESLFPAAAERPETPDRTEATPT